MKKSILDKIIREEVKAALGEAVNVEMDNLVKSFVEGIAKRNGYTNDDALFAVFESLKRLNMLANDVNFKAQ
jgi:hypothetical protein